MTIARHDPQPADPRFLLIAAVAATGIGVIGSNTLPLVLGALMDGLALDAGAAGLLGSLELGAGAGASLLLAPRIASLPRGRICLAAGVAVSIGYALSATAESYAALAAFRIATGFSAGAAVATGSAAIAAARDPDGLWARVAIAGGLLAALIVGLLPFAISGFGYRGGFAALAVVAALATPFAARLPQPPAPLSAGASGEMPNRSLALALLAAVFLQSFAEGSLWAFSERIGVGTGMNGETVGLVLGLSTLFGLAGSAIAIALGDRLGRTVPLLVGLSVSGASRFVVAHAESASVYSAAQITWGLAFFFTLPYLLGAIAKLDRLGRWSAVSAAATTIAAAAAPAAAGVLSQVAGFPAIGWLGAAAAIAAAALCVPAGLAEDRAAPKTADANASDG